MGHVPLENISFEGKAAKKPSTKTLFFSVFVEDASSLFNPVIWATHRRSQEN
jgi:hypothetical protein